MLCACCIHCFSRQQRQCGAGGGIPQTGGGALSAATRNRIKREVESELEKRGIGVDSSRVRTSGPNNAIAQGGAMPWIQGAPLNPKLA